MDDLDLDTLTAALDSLHRGDSHTIDRVVTVGRGILQAALRIDLLARVSHRTR